MSELIICRICLRTEIKAYKFEQFNLKTYYEEIMVLKINDDDFLPHYFCFECATLLHKFHKFKEKCSNGQKALEELLWFGPITYESVSNIDKDTRHLNSSLSKMTPTDRVKSLGIKYRETLAQLLKAEESKKEPKVEMEFVDDGIGEDDGIEFEPFNEPEQIFVDVKKEIKRKSMTEKRKRGRPRTRPEKPKSEKKKRVPKEKKEPKWRLLKNWGPENEVMRYHAISEKHMKMLDPNTWNIRHLNEEEASKEFAAKANDAKYVKAPHKCTKCFKWFTKQEMLTRHLKLRHSESLGKYSCRLCGMRYRVDSKLRQHMRQHFTKYECLQCNLVCELEGTARMHDEYHKGVVRKCIHCGEEYKHLSTYYTHLRTAHRSEYICTKCGVSFTSETGLKHHKRMTHLDEEEEQAKEDSSYCVRCEIKFETQKAYDEHVLHSALHAEGADSSKAAVSSKLADQPPPTKIKELKRKHNEPLPGSDGNQWKKTGRVAIKRKKPTTCYQCGKEFPTQRAYSVHHSAEHAGTSLYPPTQRHICEICGMSLTPGSWPAHINMHTREKVFSCDTCGKEFHNKINFKAHLVTHTGERPFSCSLCGKRFRQRGSVHTHYRTFHLKQPYPKRSRTRRSSGECDLGLLQKQKEEEGRSRLSLQHWEAAGIQRLTYF